MLEQMAKASVYVALPVKTLPGTPLYASPRAGFTPDLQLKARPAVGGRSPAKTVSGTISRFSQIDVTWLYLNVVMQKKNPCAGGSAGFHLSTVFGPLRSVVYRFTL
jgi:hypothetical protein